MFHSLCLNSHIGPDCHLFFLGNTFNKFGVSFSPPRKISPTLTSANPPLFSEEDWPWARIHAHLPLLYTWDAYDSMACHVVPCPHLGSQPMSPGPPRSRTCVLNCCATRPAPTSLVFWLRLGIIFVGPGWLGRAVDFLRQGSGSHHEGYLYLCGHCSPLNGGPPKDMLTSEFLEPVDITLFGKRILADVSKLRILRWKDHLGLSGGPKGQWWISFKRRPEGDLRQTEEKTQRLRQCEDKEEIGMMWLQAQEAKKHQQPPEGRRGSPRAFEAVWLGGHLDLGLLASRTVREEFPILLSQPVCGNLLQQPQDTNTGTFNSYGSYIWKNKAVHYAEHGLDLLILCVSFCTQVRW